MLPWEVVDIESHFMRFQIDLTHHHKKQLISTFLLLDEREEAHIRSFIKWINSKLSKVNTVMVIK